jgi:UDP-N-acetylglucosamine 4,6-dehydratase
LGRALIRRLIANGAERIVALSRDEVKTGDLYDEFGHDAPLRGMLCDVREYDKLTRAFAGCHYVVHGAALKRITQSIYSPDELIDTNIQGTRNVIRAAATAGVERVLFISSDKACMATNLYGKTKAVAEDYAVQSNTYYFPRTRIACVRYGNVLWSRGSVLFAWHAARLRGELLTLTHAHMTRFILTLDQAVDLILSTLRTMEGGEIVVPELPAARMADLAAAFALECAIKETHLRPGGEKIREILLSEEEIPRTVRDGNRYIVCPSHQSWSTPRWAGSHLGPTFYYGSDDPARLLTVEQIREVLKTCAPAHELVIDHAYR